MIDLDLVPFDPGCYLFKNDRGDVIYVGKAKSLRKRVRSYFQGTITDRKTSLLVSEIAAMDYFVTSNETEALVLESNLIKRYRPIYNIDLKDSHRYAYIKITDEDYPRLLVAREKDGGGRYYGPFVNAAVRDNIIKALRRSFGIRTCKRLRKRPCLRYHIGLCSAPCTGKISKTDYLENIRSIERFLDGRVSELIEDLRNEMNIQSDEKNFEKAIVLRDQIDALSTLLERQQMENDKRYNEDIINYIVDDGTVYLIIFNVFKGVLDNKAEFKFEYMDGFLDEFLTQYYSERDVPREIILPSGPGDGAIEDYLKERRGGPVRLTVPVRGRKKELLDLVRRNVETRYLDAKMMLEELRDALRLKKVPRRIECIDISHISGSHTVGSLVSFMDGRPDKSNYRRFKIRSVEGIDDFTAVSEVVRRRFNRLIREGSDMPDLLMIDGGKGQLMAAYSVLDELGAKVPVISLAKRDEDVFVPGLKNALDLPKRSLAMKLLVQVRDESHRFAIDYHRLLRSKGMIDDV
ncbi:MAG TPA: excinuclease ABC subunit UvrC [Candidatus Methanofastidiosa archaeon]|nr:excinuclease ABC subunit UvrC [Candidatus Methanofastidiosa archaeon]HPR42012.1 excinuclease ABC subunit UvrC [Candidatus Methanofastidiosa archaeon]